MNYEKEVLNRIISQSFPDVSIRTYVEVNGYKVTIRNADSNELDNALSALPFVQTFYQEYRNVVVKLLPTYCYPPDKTLAKNFENYFSALGFV